MTQQGQGDVAARLSFSARDVDGMLLIDFASGGCRPASDVEIECLYEITRLRTLLSSSRGEQGLAKLEPVVRERLTSALKDLLIYYHGTDEQQAELQADFSGPDGMLSDAEVRSLVFRNAQKALAESWELDGTLPSAPGSVPTSLAGQGTDEPTDIDKLARNIADFWFNSRGQKGGVHHSRAELTEVITRALRAAAPQPTAGGDAPTDADGCCVTCGCPVTSAAVSDAAAELARQHADALSAERARVIEACARIVDLHASEAAAENIHTLPSGIKAIAAALRALGQQDTGGAG